VSEEPEAADAGRERPRTAADRRARRSGSEPAPAGSTRARSTAVRDGGRQGKVSLPNRFVRFLREVVAELRKVIWPTRNQLVTYTIVVLVFVSFMVALVSLLDYLFGRGVLFLFGT
jgi:preprotein translocase subunit SecE